LQTLGIVVIAGDQNDRHARAQDQTRERFVEQFDRVGGRYRTIVHIAGDQDQVGLALRDTRDELFEDVLLVFDERGVIKRTSEMPIAGVDKTHTR